MIKLNNFENFLNLIMIPCEACLFPKMKGAPKSLKLYSKHKISDRKNILINDFIIIEHNPAVEF